MTFVIPRINESSASQTGNTPLTSSNVNFDQTVQRIAQAATEASTLSNRVAKQELTLDNKGQSIITGTLGQNLVIDPNQFTYGLVSNIKNRDNFPQISDDILQDPFVAGLQLLGRDNKNYAFLNKNSAQNVGNAFGFQGDDYSKIVSLQETYHKNITALFGPQNIDEAATKKYGVTTSTSSFEKKNELLGDYASLKYDKRYTLVQLTSLLGALNNPASKVESYGAIYQTTLESLDNITNIPEYKTALSSKSGKPSPNGDTFFEEYRKYAGQKNLTLAITEDKLKGFAKDYLGLKNPDKFVSDIYDVTLRQFEAVAKPVIEDEKRKLAAAKR
jgi:hypothetical protein